MRDTDWPSDCYISVTDDAELLRGWADALDEGVVDGQASPALLRRAAARLEHQERVIRELLRG